MPEQTLRSSGRAKGASAPPTPNPLNVLFLKERTKNVHENQLAKLRAS